MSTWHELTEEIEDEEEKEETKDRIIQQCKDNHDPLIIAESGRPGFEKAKTALNVMHKILSMPFYRPYYGLTNEGTTEPAGWWVVEDFVLQAGNFQVHIPTFDATEWDMENESTVPKENFDWGERCPSP